MCGSARPTGPDPIMREAWRAACVAYRSARQRGDKHDPAWQSAFEAFRSTAPDLDERDASNQVTRAISYAASEHTAWFWRGVGQGK